MKKIFSEDEIELLELCLSQFDFGEYYVRAGIDFITDNKLSYESYCEMMNKKASDLIEKIKSLR